MVLEARLEVKPAAKLSVQAHKPVSAGEGPAEALQFLIIVGIAGASPQAVGGLPCSGVPVSTALQLKKQCLEHVCYMCAITPSPPRTPKIALDSWHKVLADRHDTRRASTEPQI